MSADNVVRLPDSVRRQWRTLEPEFYDGLRGMGCTDAEATIAVERLKAVYLKYAMSKRVTINPGDAEGAIAEVEGWVKQLSTGLMFEVLMREVELIRLRGEGLL